MKCERTAEDYSLDWDLGKKIMVVFSIFQLVTVRKVKLVHPVTWNPILTVIHLLLFSCDMIVGILLLGY